MNHVRDVTAHTPAEIDILLTRVEDEFAGLPHRRFDVTNWTPPEFEARLSLAGFRREDALILVLEGDLQAQAKPHHIETIRDEAGWDALRSLQSVDWLEYNGRTGRPLEPDVGEQMFSHMRGRAEFVHWWLALVEDKPAGFFSSWKGLDGFGQVEDLFVHPNYRHRGVATALLARAVDDCRSQGVGPVVIVVDPTDTPKNMYAALGFRPVATRRSYWLNVA